MLISSAFASATEAAAATPPDAPGVLVTMAPLILIFFVFYLMVIRPQNKRVIEHRKMVNDLKKGDQVVTGGGFLATVKKIANDNEVVLEIANGVEVTALRHSIMTVRTDAKK